MLIIPAAIAYQNRLIEAVKGLNDLGIPAGFQADRLKAIVGLIETLEVKNRELSDAMADTESLENLSVRAKRIAERVVPLLDGVRKPVDALESVVDESLWPLPKYSEMLFVM